MYAGASEHVHTHTQKMIINVLYNSSNYKGDIYSTLNVGMVFQYITLATTN